ncbi:hypothetical protein SpCBS45565_g02077 [Spizellomyces sp. 'palustris']|nr:hypothetical protein SpCBS45565_g02077 [Spizellomyces sp. 'palustris']
MADSVPLRKSVDSTRSKVSRLTILSRKTACANSPTRKSPFRIQFSPSTPGSIVGLPTTIVPTIAVAAEPVYVKREAASLALAADPSYAQALVRTHYVRELVDQVRLAKGEKRDKVEIFLLKVVEKELERACLHAIHRTALLERELTDLKGRLARLSSPFKHNAREMYLIRPFLHDYVRENKQMVKDYGLPMIYLRNEDGEGNRPGKDAAFEEYFVKLKDQAKTLAQTGRNKFLSESLKLLIKLEAEFYLLECFIERSFSELQCYMRLIESLTQNQDAAVLQAALFLRLRNACTWIGTARTSLTELVSSLVPDMEDYQCSICLSVMYKPVFLSSCKHRFCRECLHQHERFSAFWAYMYWIDVQCPMCRGSYALRSKTPDKAMDNFIKLYFPVEYAEKSREAFKKRLQRKMLTLMRKNFVWRPERYWE